MTITEKFSHYYSNSGLDLLYHAHRNPLTTLTTFASRV